MFAVSVESTVKCLKGSSGIFGNGQTSSLVSGNLRQSLRIFAEPPEIFCNNPNYLKMAKNSA